MNSLLIKSTRYQYVRCIVEHCSVSNILRKQQLLCQYRCQRPTYIGASWLARSPEIPLASEERGLSEQTNQEGLWHSSTVGTLRLKVRPPSHF